MKRTAFTILLSCIILSTGCKKDSGTAPGILEGTWELLRITGGRATVNYPAGNGNLLKFSNSTYERFENSQRVKSGTFTIVDDPSASSSLCLVVRPDEYRNRIIYDGNYEASKKFFQLSKDTLSFASGCFRSDAGTIEEYVRR